MLTGNVQKLKEREDTWKTLDDPNIVAFLCLCHQEPYPVAIVTPFYANGNANDYLRKLRAQYQEEEFKTGTAQDVIAITVLHILRGAAHGLDYLHGKSIVHEAIRGRNVLIGDDGSARLGDYDLESALDRNTFTTADFVGPVRWWAPEILEYQGDDILSNAKTDVFAFSMLCIELITGSPPFKHQHNAASVVVEIIRKGRPRKPRNSPIADKMWPILQRGWAHEPSERPEMSLERRWGADLSNRPDSSELQVCEWLDGIEL
ncbi:hypothetical protein HWV62_33053 [Athelia sp. TMB]|nr:hypothetical protein HWV62_33053 [Athelia sp. TMB]